MPILLLLKQYGEITLSSSYNPAQKRSHFGGDKGFNVPHGGKAKALMGASFGEHWMVIISLAISLAFLVSEICQLSLRAELLGILEGILEGCGRKIQGQDMTTGQEEEF